MPSKSLITPEEFVEVLYGVLLGRPPEPSALANGAEIIRSTSKPSIVLKAVTESPEYAARQLSRVTPDCTREIDQALALIGRPLRIVDVGAQSLGAQSHPYASLLKIAAVEIIGFDPLDERLRERAETEPLPGLTLLPYAIGDGGTYTLFINNDDATSSLFPLNEADNAAFNHLNELRTVRTKQITTHRLDDVLPKLPVDFLKLDVQGAELMVLKGAQQTLARTAVVHCEVSFSPMYVGQALFPAIQEHLMANGFTLIDLLVSGRNHYLTPSGRTTQDRLIWADAVFFSKTDDAEVQRVQALIAASVYGKPTLAEHMLRLADRSLFPAGHPKDRVTAEAFHPGRKEANSPLTVTPSVERPPGWERMEMTVSCTDAEVIPKAPQAGLILPNVDGISCQIMHNGLRVLAGAYHGAWMSEVIRRLRGHHEPQEELLFHAVLPLITSVAPVMVELGSFWSYYSLWFRSAHQNARNILVEPDSNNLQIGLKNFELNGFRGEFQHAALGIHDKSVDFRRESDGTVQHVRTVSVDGLVRELGLERIHLLHADIQGAELTMLEGLVETIERGRLDWLFLSTHHHSISGDPLTHQQSLNWLRAHGASIIDEHTVSESYSGDGLIVAAFGPKPQLTLPRISRNRASKSLFRETEYDLADARDEIRRLRNQP